MVEITGPRRLAIGLVIPGKFMAFTKSAAGNRTKIKRTGNAYNSLDIKELYKHMEKKITGNDLTEKKLFSCTDAAVVDA